MTESKGWVSFLFQFPVQHDVSDDESARPTADLCEIPLLNHFVRAIHERSRNHDPKRLRGLKIDHHLESRWLLDRNVGGLRALEDFVHELIRPPQWRSFALPANGGPSICSRESSVVKDIEAGHVIGECRQQSFYRSGHLIGCAVFP
jgi:hypothetical protein